MTAEERDQTKKLLEEVYLVGQVTSRLVTGMDVHDLARFVGVLSVASSLGTDIVRRAADPESMAAQLGARILAVGNILLDVGQGHDPFHPPEGAK
jgi:hypothetical protein